MVFAPILARFADRLGRRLFLVGGPLFSVVGAVMLSLATQPADDRVRAPGRGPRRRLLHPHRTGDHRRRHDPQPSHPCQRQRRVRGRQPGRVRGWVRGRSVRVPLAAPRRLSRAGRPLRGGGDRLRRAGPLRAAAAGRARCAGCSGPSSAAGPLRSFLPAWIACFALLGAYAAHLPALLRRALGAGPDTAPPFRRAPGLGDAGQLDRAAARRASLLWTPRIPKIGAVRIMRLATPGAWLIAAALLAMNHTAIAWTPIFLPLPGRSACSSSPGSARRR